MSYRQYVLQGQQTCILNRGFEKDHARTTRNPVPTLNNMALLHLILMVAHMWLRSSVVKRMLGSM